MIRLFALIAAIAMPGSAAAFDQGCRDKLTAAAKMGLLQNMELTGAGMEFVVDEDIFRGMAFRSKQGLVDTINCGLLEKVKRFNPIIFRSHRTNKEVGRDEWGKLTVK